MEKKQATIIVNGLLKWRKKDMDIQKAVDNFVGVVADGSYSPILTESFAFAYIDGVCQGNTELMEWMTYFLYEVPSAKIIGKGERWNVDDGKGGKYDFNLKKDFIRFLVNNY